MSDRAMSVKQEIEGVMMNVASGYALQVACEMEEEKTFWSELDDTLEHFSQGGESGDWSTYQWLCW